MNQLSANSPDDAPVAPRPKDKELSGRVIIAAMFLLGLALTALLFVYFEFNSRPFRPLRDAIGREFKRSRPNVEGGRSKGRGVMTLRITMSVPFNPFQEDSKSRELLARVLFLARQHQDLTRYEKCEVNLIHFVPEKTAITKSYVWPGTDAAKDNFAP